MAAPALSSLAPSTGIPAGGTIVVLTGTGFTGATAIDFGPNSAIIYNVDSDTQITTVSPAGVGIADVSVTTPAGTSPAKTSTQFTYTVPSNTPRVTALSPSSGATAGGIVVILTGSGFTGAGAVKFGAVSATSFTVISDNEISATTPALSAGTVNVTVVTAAGTSSAKVGNQFVFAALATITSVVPSLGGAAGGTQVVITGVAFTGATAVNFGATPASFTFDSDTQITATSPAGSGTVDITITTAAGTSTAILADKFTQIQASGVPVVSAISPAAGPIAGGTAVTITGENFTGATAVAFGANGAPSLTVTDDTQIIAISPPGSAGTVDVTVMSPAGTSPVVAVDAYTYS